MTDKENGIRGLKHDLLNNDDYLYPSQLWHMVLRGRRTEGRVMADREKVIKRLECRIGGTKCGICPYNNDDTALWCGDYLLLKDALTLLKAQEAVVRCKDCKYGEPDTNGRGEDMVMCQNKLNPMGYEDWLMPPEFFCADGERRDE